MHDPANELLRIHLSSMFLLVERSLVAWYALHNVSTDVGVCFVAQERCDLICVDAPSAEAIRERLLREGTARDAAERAKALSDPTRLTLAEALREGEELCVCDLSWIVGRSQNLVSHHLGTLRSRGLVRSRKEGKMVMYSLTGAGASLLSAVVGDTKTSEVRT
jgi:ArsR family transcriptional regulator, lead/cadmium/zinc/bismuth-responsive transcriptional repressor